MDIELPGVVLKYGEEYPAVCSFHIWTQDTGTIVQGSECYCCKATTLGGVLRQGVEGQTTWQYYCHRCNKEKEDDKI